MGKLNAQVKKFAKQLLKPVIAMAIREEYIEREYCLIYPDVAQSGWDPLWHYLKFGKAAGLPGRFPRVDYSRLTPERVEKWRKTPKNGIAVCTSLCGDRETLLPPAYINDGWEYICYSDRPRPSYGIWEIRPIPYENDDPRRRSRWAKLHLPELFPSHDWVFWLDSNIVIRDSLAFLLSGAKENSGWEGVKSPFRECVYEEARVCIENGLDSKDVINAQIQEMLACGMPRNYGMTENNFFMINPRLPFIKSLFSQWWEEYERFSCRDQLSLPYVFFRNGFWPDCLLEDGKSARNWNRVIYILHHLTPHIKTPHWLEEIQL